ncbi:ERV-BabFcenv provirus ancestral Env polyprotein-like [Artibeus jamaicensis]|uniref:ERV-BabFcenv provirus ancestral Env polyprotein-like n=1 Tax=Artibeus jamaicensis TaxID=9417 RepID=UPI00235AC5FD|nr:ERV-BabFcenv provirus ancestral Env polyprotein-like [Artibeus jamaicensis]
MDRCSWEHHAITGTFTVFGGFGLWYTAPGDWSSVNATPSETARSSPGWHTGPVKAPLYENQGEESYLNSSDWCKGKKNTTLRPPDGLFFWANQTLLPKINCSDTQVYFLVALAPQLFAYPPGELEAKYMSSTLHKQAVFLPVLVGLSLAASIAGISAGGAGLATSLQSQEAIRQELNEALSSVATSMASLQRQILSLARVSQ